MAFAIKLLGSATGELKSLRAFDQRRITVRQKGHGQTTEEIT